jgi:hypothetical protein
MLQALREELSKEHTKEELVLLNRILDRAKELITPPDCSTCED